MVFPSDDEFVAIAASPFPSIALRQYYSDAAQYAIRTTDAIPFLIPGTFVGSFIIPSLFLAISQKKYPWVKPFRYAVFVLVAAVNLDVLRRSTSTNVACGYGNGMITVWGTMVAAMVLVFTDGQDLERVAKRVKPRSSDDGKKDGNVTEYYWQSFPHDASFMTRYLWGFDLVSSLRGAGWTWAISSLPSPPLPTRPHTEEKIDMAAMPLVSKAGFRRCTSQSEFLWKTIPIIVSGFLILDALSILVEMDPFFMMGPRGLLPPFEYPPAHLSWIPEAFMPLYRELFFFTCILTSLNVVFNWVDLVQYFFFSLAFPLRAEPWQYTPIFGPVTAVLDSGLGGLWGITWHQTFRAPFTAPVRWLWGPGKGRFPGKKMALLVTAFVGSGLMHSGASYTAVPSTKFLEPMMFFLFQALGIAIQRGIGHIARLWGIPKGIRRLGNVLFVLGWLYWSAMLLGDDFATGGIWMMEPSPYSVLRALGFGYPGDSPWRWGGGYSGSWFTGKGHFWEIGYGI